MCIQEIVLEANVEKALFFDNDIECILLISGCLMSIAGGIPILKESKCALVGVCKIEARICRVLG